MKISENKPDVVAMLRRYIHKKGYMPGDQLPKQQELCEELSVGIRRLREGLNILQEQGWVETRKKGGTVICKPDISYLHETVNNHLEYEGYTYEQLVEARAVFESAAVKEAARKRTVKDLLKILETIERMEDLQKQGKVDETADQDFHLALLKATHNPVIEVFGTLIVRTFFPKIKGQFLASEEIRKITLDEHRNIFEAVQQQDAALAEKLLYEHIIAPLRGREINEQEKN